MKSWFMPIVCAAALSLPMLSSEARADVADKAYDVTVVTTAFDFFGDVFEFDSEGGVTSSTASGDYFEIDFGIASFFNLSLVDNEDPEFEVNLVGLQFDTIILGRGSDSDGVQYFYLGEEQVPAPE